MKLIEAATRFKHITSCSAKSFASLQVRLILLKYFAKFVNADRLVYWKKGFDSDPLQAF